MSFKIEFLEPAAADLLALHAWVENAVGSEIADSYLARLKTHCLKLSEFPDRGTPRDDLMQGVRSLSFEKRLRVFYRVEERTVYVMHIVSAFRDTPTLEA